LGILKTEHGYCCLFDYQHYLPDFTESWVFDGTRRSGNPKEECAACDLKALFHCFDFRLLLTLTPERSHASSILFKISAYYRAVLPEGMKREMCGFLHLTERKKANAVRLAGFI
jgi:hypothetical protein